MSYKEYLPLLFALLVAGAIAVCTDGFDFKCNSDSRQILVHVQRTANVTEGTKPVVKQKDIRDIPAIEQLDIETDAFHNAINNTQ